MPPATGSAAQWAEREVYVATGPKQGRFSLKETPYAREPIDCFGDKEVRNLVLDWGAQSSKSTVLIIGLLYRIARDPRDALWVSANADLAKGFSKERWQPWAKRCPQVNEQIPKNRRGEPDKHQWGFMNQQFNNMLLNFMGSNSPANLSSRPVGILVLDETDKYAEQSKFEAGALQLVEERVKAYDFSFIAKASTPTTEGRVIWPEFLKTDQRYYRVPCPRCGQEIRLLFTVKTQEHGLCGVRWWRDSQDEAKTDGEWDMAKVVANAHYRCQKCGKEFMDWERYGMIENGIWRPTNLNAPKDSRGYHLSSLYSVISEATSIPSIAVKWLQASKQIGGRQNFFNSWMAETWSMDKAFDETEVTHEVYVIETTPQADGSVLIAFVDVQTDHFWVVIRKFAKRSPEKPFGESWLIVADRCETEEELVKLQQEHRVEGANFVLDMRGNKNVAAGMIVRNGWRGAMGVDTPQEFAHTVPGGKVYRPFSEVCYRDPFLGTGWQDRTLDRARYVKFHKETFMDIQSALKTHSPVIWHTHANVHPLYQKHLNAVVKRMQLNPKTQRMEAVWTNVSNQDHLLDCEVGLGIRALQLGLIAVPGDAPAVG